MFSNICSNDGNTEEHDMMTNSPHVLHVDLDPAEPRSNLQDSVEKYMSQMPEAARPQTCPTSEAKCQLQEITSKTWYPIHRVMRLHILQDQHVQSFSWQPPL